MATWFGVVVLVVLLVSVAWQARQRVGWEFVTSHDSTLHPERAGVWGGLMGSLWLMLLTAIFSVPVGVGAAIYLEEYAGDTRMTRLIRVNLANLAGVPSIVYGILGLTVFVRMFGLFSKNGPAAGIDAVNVLGVRIPLPFEDRIISGALTLSLLILPIIIVASQEALRAVPPSIRHASFALGATRWETIRYQVLPVSLPGICTGVILALSRAIGETAPLVMVGAATFYLRTPDGPFSFYTAIPMQIYNWVTQPQPEYREAAATAILVLLTGLLFLNGMAIYIRNHYQKKLHP
jgi:phosphate transport system permease protein